MVKVKIILDIQISAESVQDQFYKINYRLSPPPAVFSGLVYVYMAIIIFTGLL